MRLNRGSGKDLDIIAPVDQRTGKRVINIDNLPDDVVTIKKLLFQKEIKLDKKTEAFSIKTSNGADLFSLGRNAFQESSGAIEADLLCDLRVTNIIERSSLRLKKDIIPINFSEEKIKKLNPVKFTWRETNRRDIGFIAEEVEKVIPEAVDGDKLKSVKYSKLTSLLAAGMKEVYSKLEEQDKVIKKLKQEVETLKGKINGS